jgi:hypothetical protein
MYTFFNWWIGIFCRESDGGVKAGEALGAGSMILIPLDDFPATFLVFLWEVG